jgi:hypothetical protein
MHLHTNFTHFVCLAAALAAASCTWAASPTKAVQLQAKSSSGVDLLTIAPAQAKAAGAIAIHFVHREASAACSFEMVTEATRLPQTGDLDDFNEAMPDGSYVRFANYKAQTEAFKELSVDVSSMRPQFASVTVKLPPGYDTKKCRHRGREIDVIFFGT